MQPGDGVGAAVPSPVNDEEQVEQGSGGRAVTKFLMKLNGACLQWLLFLTPGRVLPGWIWAQGAGGSCQRRCCQPGPQGNQAGRF